MRDSLAHTPSKRLEFRRTNGGGDPKTEWYHERVFTSSRDADWAKCAFSGRILAALGLPASGDEAGVPYTAIRGNDGPRWILPSRSALADIILREWRPYRLLTHLSWCGIRLAARCGVLAYLPGTAQVWLPREAGNRILEQAGFEGDAGEPVILVGNPHARRKLIAFLEIEGRGRVATKLPMTPLAKDSICTEAEVLRRLNGQLGAPRLLGCQADTSAAMQEYLPGKLGARRLKSEYLKLMIALARPEERMTLRGRAKTLRERLSERGAPDETRTTDDENAIARALTLLEDDTEIPTALVHGDFVPWNLREQAEGGCSLIDWEAAEWSGVPLHDLCHFFYMQTKLFSPRSDFYARMVSDGSWRAYCDVLNIPHALVPRLAAAFLLQTLTQPLDHGPGEYAGYCLNQLKGLCALAERKG